MTSSQGRWCRRMAKDTPVEDMPASVLVIGPMPGKHDLPNSVQFASSLSSSPTLYEFGVILVRYSNDSFQSTSHEKWKEWQDFLRTGGIAVVIGVDVSIQRYARNLIGKPLPGLIEQTGQRVLWTRGTEFYSAFSNQSRAEWKAKILHEEEHQVNILARNSAGDVIGFEVQSGNGSVAFMPRLRADTGGRELLNMIVCIGRQHELKKDRRVAPGWLHSIVLSSEVRTRSELEEASNRLEKLERAKRILFEEGETLSRDCARILSEMLSPEGFDVQWKEKEAAHDIEIVRGALTILVEVRGTSGQLDVAIGRQLMDHIQDFIPTTTVMRGLIIGNPFRNKDPKGRGPPYTESLLKLARRNGYSLVTTTQLLEMYDEFMEGHFKADELINLLTTTTGPITRPSSGSIKKSINESPGGGENLGRLGGFLRTTTIW